MKNGNYVLDVLDLSYLQMKDARKKSDEKASDANVPMLKSRIYPFKRI
jgi:hypothetical protein